LVPLTLDKVAPTPENAAKGLYPIAKQHHLIIREHASDDVLRFVKFIRSEEGQAILRAHGHWIP
jgi:ABC-type phosphate transport system substrate-binding protein